MCTIIIVKLISQDIMQFNLLLSDASPPLLPNNDLAALLALPPGKGVSRTT